MISIEILHSHSVHTDLGLISTRLRLNDAERVEDFQFYTSLDKVKANPSTLEDFICKCKDKARRLFLGDNSVTPVAPKEAPVAPKEAPVAPKEAPVAPKEAPVAPTPVAPAPVVSKPVDLVITLEDVTARAKEVIKENFTTLKAFSAIYGGTAGVSVSKYLFDNGLDVTLDNMMEFLASLVEAKEVKAAEKEEVVYFSKPQKSENLQAVQSQFMQQTYLSVSSRYSFNMTTSEVIAGLTKNHSPIELASRIGSGEYTIHPALEGKMVAVFEAKKAELESF